MPSGVVTGNIYGNSISEENKARLLALGWRQSITGAWVNSTTGQRSENAPILAEGPKAMTAPAANATGGIAAPKPQFSAVGGLSMPAANATGGIAPLGNDWLDMASSADTRYTPRTPNVARAILGQRTAGPVPSLRPIAPPPLPTAGSFGNVAAPVGGAAFGGVEAPSGSAPNLAAGTGITPANAQQQSFQAAFGAARPPAPGVGSVLAPKLLPPSGLEDDLYSQFANMGNIINPAKGWF